MVITQVVYFLKRYDNCSFTTWRYTYVTISMKIVYILIRFSLGTLKLKVSYYVPTFSCFFHDQIDLRTSFKFPDFYNSCLKHSHVERFLIYTRHVEAKLCPTFHPKQKLQKRRTRLGNKELKSLNLSWLHSCQFIHGPNSFLPNIHCSVEVFTLTSHSEAQERFPSI